MRRDGPLKILRFPTGGRPTHSTTGFSLMTSLTAAVSRGSAEDEILLRRAFHDGFNCIKVAPLKSRSNFPIKRCVYAVCFLMSLKTKPVRRFSHCLQWTAWTTSLGNGDRQSGWSLLSGWRRCASITLLINDAGTLRTVAFFTFFKQ